MTPTEEQKKKWEAEKEAAAPCPTGRVQVDGTVLKVEERTTQWGNRTVMTVKDKSGYVVWLSVPKGVTVEKDCKIVFIATITPSENDSKFGFGKIPKLLKEKA